ncbi:hypothetical protein PTTG_00893, partial [Puccinia triticina 1-1 BBBD Race 1]
MVPHKTIGQYFAQCAFGCINDGLNDDRPGARNICDSALRYLGENCPSAQSLMLDEISVLYVSEPWRLKMTDMLKTALKYSHHKLFQTVGVRHQGNLPFSFFDWIKEWLTKLSGADRAEKYRTWIPLLIQGYPSMTEILSIIRTMSCLTGGAALSSTWARDVARRCIARFPEVTKKPTISDGELIMSAVIDLDEAWPEKFALLVSIFNRFPKADATAFLLAILSRLKTQAAAAHLSISATIELYRSLSLRFVNTERRLSDIITTGKTRSKTRSRPMVPWIQSTRDLKDDAKLIYQMGMTVTPEALVQFACDLNDISTNTVNSIQPFIQEIIAQCHSFSAEDMQELWMPFLYQLITALLSRPVVLHMSSYQQLTRELIDHLVEKVIGPPPQASDFNQTRRVACSCSDCKDLNQFLQYASQGVRRYPLASARRHHLEQQIDSARIPCSQDTVETELGRTLVVTKRYTLEVRKWNER